MAAWDLVRRTAVLCRRADAPGGRCSPRGFCVSCGVAEETIPIMDSIRPDQAVPTLGGIRQYSTPIRCYSGDLHPGNVMASPDGSVCWVDTDSFQIEDYPCSVGTERFRAPELRGNYEDFLRTRSHDTYALSVLLFMTLTLGLFPFTRQGSGEDMQESVRKGTLPYPFSLYKPPPGSYPPDTPGRYVWSYLLASFAMPLGTTSPVFSITICVHASPGVSGALFSSIPQGYGAGRQKISSHIPGTSARPPLSTL